MPSVTPPQRFRWTKYLQGGEIRRMENLIATVVAFFRERYHVHYAALETISPNESLSYDEGENRIRFQRDPGCLKITITLNRFRNPEDVSDVVEAGESEEEIRAKLLRLVKAESPTLLLHVANFGDYEADARDKPLVFSVDRRSDKDGMRLTLKCARGEIHFDDTPKPMSATDWIKFCVATDAVWAIGYQSQILSAVSKM